MSSLHSNDLDSWNELPRPAESADKEPMDDRRHADRSTSTARMQDVAVNSPNRNHRTSPDFDSVTKYVDDDDEAMLHDIPIPVHSVDAGHSLPTATEVRNTVHPVYNKPILCRSRWVAVTVAVLVAFSIILGIAVGVNHHSKISSTQTRYSATVEYLVRHNISKRADLEAEGSPQKQAASWLANMDSSKVSVPDVGVSDAIGYHFMARYILALNYYALLGPSWSVPLGFLSELDICEWIGAPAATDTPQGVVCDVFHGLPVHLDLRTYYNYNLHSVLLSRALSTARSQAHSQSRSNSFFRSDGNGLKGEIPTENGMLTTLLSLDLEHNYLAGTLPTELCKLKNLESFLVGWNHLASSIPSCVGDLSGLSELYLNDNKLTGPLPDELGQLRRLSHLFIEYNLLTGDPSNVFNNLTNLEILMANNNYDMYSRLDDMFLSNNTNLRWVDLSDNSFLLFDVLPAQLLKLSNLEVLDLSKNRLSGSLPSDISKNTILKYLSLYGNEIFGTLPPELKNLSSLVHLDLSNNQIDGPLISELGLLTDLRLLFLGDNSFNAGSLPVTFENLTMLEDLCLRGTKREGPVPTWFPSTLKYLDLGSNKFTGDIPSSFDKLNRLEFLVLGQNPNITGSHSFSKLKRLRALFLDGTNLSNVTGVCDLPRFKSKGNNGIVYTDCGGNRPPFDCQCCKCCNDTLAAEGCSVPFQLDLRSTWTDIKNLQKLGFTITNQTIILNPSFIPPAFLK